MPDCFISYSSKDENLARFIYQELTRQNLSVFMASVSLMPGQDWTTQIKENLNSSNWVIFLASRSACKSPYVLQETGMAMITNKNLIPIVWDMSPLELPGWIDRHHALNLKDANIFQIQAQIAQIAKTIQEDKTKGILIVGAAILGLIWLGNRS